MKNIKFFFVLCAFVFALTSCGGGSSPKEVAVKSTECIFSGDFANYVKMLNVLPEKQANFKSLLDDKGGTILKQVEQNGGVESIVAEEETLSEDGNSCEVKVKVCFKDGSDQTQDVKLEKVDGEWLLADPMANK